MFCNKYPAKCLFGFFLKVCLLPGCFIVFGLHSLNTSIFGLGGLCFFSLCFCPFNSSVSSLTTSSEMSEELDHQELQLALQASKLVAHNKIRARFHSSSDLIHRLFVCISGMCTLWI